MSAKSTRSFSQKLVWQKYSGGSYVKYIIQRNYQAHKLLSHLLYFPGGCDHKRISLTDDIQLPSTSLG